MELIITDAKGVQKVVLVDDQMKIVKPVLGFQRFQKQKGCEDNSNKPLHRLTLFLIN